MTDYYPLIARAVAGLAKSTGENRRALYERARSALLAQLRNLDPPLAESEITRERLLLEEAVRKVEADAARQQRAESPRSSPTVKDRPVEPAAREAEPGATEPDEPAAGPQTALDPGAAKPASAPVEKRDDPRASAGSAQWAGQFRSKDRERSEHAAAQALKGFRDLVAEVRGEAARRPKIRPASPLSSPRTTRRDFPSRRTSRSRTWNPRQTRQNRPNRDGSLGADLPRAILRSIGSSRVGRNRVGRAHRGGGACLHRTSRTREWGCPHLRSDRCTRDNPPSRGSSAKAAA